MTNSKTTTNHQTIREWAEERDGTPSMVKDTRNNGSGVLRIDFDGKEDSLEEISWDQFFDVFDENNLAFLYQEETNGSKSRFFKLVERE